MKRLILSTTYRPPFHNSSIMCKDYTCWQRMLDCICARLPWLSWHIPIVWRGIEHSCQNLKVCFGFQLPGEPVLALPEEQGFAVSVYLFAQFLYLGVFRSRLSPSQHFCYSPSTSDFPLSLSHSPCLYNVLSCVASGLSLALSSFSHGEC